MKIITKEAFRAVGFKVTAPFNELHTKVPNAWKTLNSRLNEISNRKEDIMTEISLKVKDGVYTELVGAEVEGNATVPEGMTEVNIPEQSYIYYQHKGTLSEIAKSFGKMYEWAERNGHEAGDFKIDYGYKPHGSDSNHDLYIKIKA